MKSVVVLLTLAALTCNVYAGMALAFAVIAFFRLMVWKDEKPDPYSYRRHKVYRPK